MDSSRRSNHSDFVEDQIGRESQAVIVIPTEDISNPTAKECHDPCRKDENNECTRHIRRVSSLQSLWGVEQEIS